MAKAFVDMTRIFDELGSLHAESLEMLKEAPTG